MRYAEAEKKVHEEDDMINNLAVLVAMKSTDDPAPRNGAPKGRKNQKPPIVESDIIAESPGPSPSDGRAELMKRVKGTSQRSSSTASQTRAPAKEEIVETNRGPHRREGGSAHCRRRSLLQVAEGNEGC